MERKYVWSMYLPSSSREAMRENFEDNHAMIRTQFFVAAKSSDISSLYILFISLIFDLKIFTTSRFSSDGGNISTFM